MKFSGGSSFSSLTLIASSEGNKKYVNLSDGIILSQSKGEERSPRRCILQLGRVFFASRPVLLER